jgi:aminomethyltransferase
MLKQTVLYASHVAANAKMVDFGGWHMPLAYGSQVEEHHRVRKAAGMFDVSHMLNVDVEGHGAREFLRYLLANDVDKLTVPGRALYSCMLNEEGGVIDDLIVYFLEEGRFRVVVNAGTAETDVFWMHSVIGSRSFNASVTPRRDLAMIAVQGPEARAAVWTARPDWRAATEPLIPFSAAEIGADLIGRTGYTGEDGFEIVLPTREAAALWKDLLAAGVAPCGLGARDTLRLEAGMNLYGNDMDETTSPLESGLGWTVELKSEREFIGRETLELAPPQRRLVGLKLLERGVLRAHMRVATEHGDGEVTSGTFSPTLGFSIALARVPVAVAVGDAVQVDVRGKLLPAQVVKTPFVRHGKALIQ